MGIKTIYLPCALAVLAVLLATCAAQAPLGYQCVNGYNCYKIYTDKRTWGEAGEICKADGASLGIINSDQEAFIFSGLFSATPDENELYLGIHDLFNEGTWLTIDCGTLAQSGYAKWKAGEPNNADNEDCGAMRQGGLINDVKCDNKDMFICEIERDV